MWGNLCSEYGVQQEQVTGCTEDRRPIEESRRLEARWLARQTSRARDPLGYGWKVRVVNYVVGDCEIIVGIIYKPRQFREFGACNGHDKNRQSD